MPRVKVGLADPDRKTLDAQIARLRDLGVGDLQARWRTEFRRRPPHRLPRHLLFRVLAYHLQAVRLGQLEQDVRRILERSDPSADLSRLAADLERMRPSLKPGTVLTREWDGHLQHVMVLADGFSWKGDTYPSLSKVASAITGTRWNGPRFFGLRDPTSTASSP
jgi:hypothetical protein